MKKISKNKKPKFNPKIYIPLGTTIVTILLSLIVMVVMGLDKKYFGSVVNGYVYDTSGNPVEDVEVLIGDKLTSSDQFGFYEIRELDYGLVQAALKKNGYADLQSEIKLERFDNEYLFEIEPLEYGEIKYKLNFEGGIFYSSELEILLNGNFVELDKNWDFTTGRVLSGEYDLKILSPYYLDIDHVISVTPGLTNEIVELAVRGDLRAEIIDHVSGESIEVDRIQMGNGDLYIDIESKFVEKDKVNILDLEVGQQVNLRVFKKGYNDFQQTIEIKPGINSLGQIKLVPEGSLITITKMGGASKINAVDYVGNVLIEIKATNTECMMYKHFSTLAYIKCEDTLYKISNKADKSVVLMQYTLPSNIFFADESGTVLVLNLDFYIQSLSTNEIVYSGNEEVTSIAKVSSEVILTTVSGVYKIMQTDGENTLEEVTSGGFKILGIYEENVLLANYVDGESLNIWKLNIDTGRKDKLTFLPAIYRNIMFGEDGTVYFRKQLGNTWGFYNDFVGASSIQGVWGYYPILNDNLLFINKNGEDYLYNLENGALIPMK